jgi:hypothetical protein
VISGAPPAPSKSHKSHKSQKHGQAKLDVDVDRDLITSASNRVIEAGGVAMIPGGVTFFQSVDASEAPDTAHARQVLYECLPELRRASISRGLDYLLECGRDKVC